jgi:hypothetical protein
VTEESCVLPLPLLQKIRGSAQATILLHFLRHRTSKKPENGSQNNLPDYTHFLCFANTPIAKMKFATVASALFLASASAFAPPAFVNNKNVVKSSTEMQMA